MNDDTSWYRAVTGWIERSLDAYFCLTERGTTVGTELRAGTASFLTLSYLLLVNPQLLARAGVPNALFATAVSSALACAIVGLLGNLPVAMAPGLGLSAYLTFGLVLAGGDDNDNDDENHSLSLSTAQALGVSWWSGMVVLLVCGSGATNLLIRIVPSAIKHAIVVGMGLLIAMIGLVGVGMIVANPKTLVQLGDVGVDADLQLCLLGILLLTTLLHHEVNGAILLAIGAMTILSWTVHGDWPDRVFQWPVVDDLYWSPQVLWDWPLSNITWPAMGAFALICIFDISGVLFGLTTLAGLRGRQDHDGDEAIPGAFYAFVASGVGTLVAALLGSTPIIVCVECAAGIREGGKTGLTAVVMSLYFLASIFLAPLFQSVPVVATAPVLVLVGVMMMSEANKIAWDKMADALPAFLTMLLMPLTYSITNGMLFGLASAACLYVTTGRLGTDLAACSYLRQCCRKSSSAATTTATVKQQGQHEECDPLLDADICSVTYEAA
jgi:adenine/guanine/hypoxanthine permease